MEEMVQQARVLLLPEDQSLDPTPTTGSSETHATQEPKDQTPQFYFREHL